MARTKDFDEDEVLNKAMELFWHKGYNGTSMQDLIDTIGISRSSLYDTYKDKHTLYIKTLERYQKKGTDKIQQIVASSGSAKAIVKKLLEFIITDMLCDGQQKGCFIVNAEVEIAPHDVEVNELVCRNDQQMEQMFVHVIQRGIDKGEIKNSLDAQALARFIFNSIKGMRVSAKSVTDKAFFDDIISLAVSVL